MCWSYGKILKEISKLAFKELKQNKIVFTTVELQETCPCLESHIQSENWNGLGLLKAVQLFTVENNLRNVSFNFLHFTIQEILAAYHITLMSEDEQLKCMRETFWDNRYYNTWIMYVGLTKTQLPIALKHFLSGNWFLMHTRFLNWWTNGTYCSINRPIINDKIKCLHLFQCFSEAENNDLCQYVGHLLQENEIDLSGQTLSAVNILTISLFLTRSTTKHWKILNLSECFIGDDGIKQLHNSFTSNNRSKVCIDTLNLSHNNLTQSSVKFIAGLILEWNVKSITFNDINQYNLNEEVMYQVMQFPIEQNNFITCNFNKNEVIFARLSQLDYLLMSFSATSNKGVTKIATTFTSLQANSQFANTDRLKIIIHVLKDCAAINYLNLGTNISQLEIYDITALIRNNKYMEYLYLPKLQYSTLNEKLKLKLIIGALKSNKSLQYVDMSLTTIDSDLISDIAVVMKNKSKLKELKFSKLMLRHNDFQHFENYLVKITGLKSLNITGYIFNSQDADKLAIIIKENFEIWQLNLSNCKVPIDHLLNILSYESIMENLNWLDLSNCQLYSKEIKQILGVLKKMKYLQHVNLSANVMTSDAINETSAMIKNNKCIQSLSLPNHVFSQEDLKLIMQAMHTISSLQFVDFNTNIVNNELANDVATIFANNCELKQLNCTRVALKHSSFQKLKSCFVKLRGLRHLSITDCKVTNYDVALLETFIYINHTIQELIVSNCRVINNKVITTVKGHVGVFDQLVVLDLSGNNSINCFVVKLSVFLCCSSKLKQINICNCHLQPDNIKQVLMVLKYMRHLETVDLSGNDMTDDSVSDMEAMIVNNKNLQKLCLPDCVLNQADLRIIIQAMQTVSSLQYVNFSTNKLYNELASDLTFLVSGELFKEIYFLKSALNPSGFHHIKNYLYILKGLKIFSITDCNFTRQDAVNVITIISNNSEIQELNLRNCKMDIDQLLTIISCCIQLKWLELSNCQLHSEEIKQILGVLKHIKNLRCVNLSANTMTDSVANDIADMIINNKGIQELYLPDGVLAQTNLRIVIQAMQTVSSLQYVDFNAIKIDHELANDIAIFCANNTKLEQLMFTKLELDQNGYNYLKTFLVKFCGIKYFSITDCDFTDQDTTNVAIVFTKNAKIQELSLSNCNVLHKMYIIRQLKVISLLQYLKLKNITITDVIEDEVITIINNNNNLEYLEIAECNMSKTLYVKLIQCPQLKNISKLNFSSNSIMRKEIKQFLHVINSHTKLTSLNLSKCQLQSYEINQIFKVLKKTTYLQCVNLSENTMTVEVVNDIADMITNNKDLQKLYLPNCELNQSALRIIIQAMRAVSSLQYVDFSTSKLDNELANDVAVLIDNNRELEKIKFSELIMNKNCFQHLKNYLEKVEGLKLLAINSCNFTKQDSAKVVTACDNSEIQKLSLSHCTIHINELTSIISHNTKLKWLDLSNCHLDSKEVKIIFSVLKHMKYLQCVNVSANTMTDDATNEIAATIINNEDIQKIYLPDCILKDTNLRIIIQAMQAVSSLEYVDFSTNEVDNELASDVAILISNNNNLEILKFSGLTMDQSGFDHVKNHLSKIKGLKSFSITGCNFTRHDAANIKTAISNNCKIQEISLPNCQMHFDQLLSILSCNIILKWLDLSNCQLYSKQIIRLFSVLKMMKYLQHVNLSGNTMHMKDNAINHMADMIKNNEDIKLLSLPNCVLDQKYLRIIIQAMQTVSSLEYVDFNNNFLDNELASDVALLFTKNDELNELKFSKLKLNQSGFQNLNNYLVKIKGLLSFNLISCFFTEQDTVKLLTAISNNPQIQEINLSNCIMPANLSLSILSCTHKLKWLNLSNCLFQSNETKRIFSALNQMMCLQHVDLSANIMKSDAVNEIASMIKYNKHIQVLSLPNGVMSQEDLRIIIQAMQTVSSLHYVDFNANKIDNGLASEVAILIDNNTDFGQLIFARFELDQDGFNNLKSHLNVFRGVRYFKIVGCTFTDQDVANLATAINNNPGIEELDLSYNKAFYETEMLCIFLKFKTLLYLRCLKLNDITITNEMEHEIITVIHNNSNLEHLEMIGCNLSNIFIITIKSRKNLHFK